MVSRRPRRRSIRLEAGSVTHVGRIRDVNQDDVVYTDDVFVVADGMGGHRGGEVASTVATVAVVEGFVGPDRAALVRAVRQANRAVLQRAAEDPDLSGMGTTLCVLAVVDGPGGQGGPDALAVVNIGDSRVYRLDAGGLVRVSDDHSLVADLVRAGELTAEEAAVHPQRNILTRALGIEADPTVDSWELSPARGDRYLLCSDGLFNELGDARIAELLGDGPAQEVASRLVAEAVAEGGHDNVTVLVVEVVEGPEVPSGGRPPIPEARPERATGPVRSRPAGDDPRATVRTTVGSVAAVVIAVALVLSLYARQGWFIGDDEGDVAVFRGRASGILWFDPAFVEGGDLRVALLDDSTRAAVVETIPVGTLDEARRLIEGFRTHLRDPAPRDPDPSDPDSSDQ
jgi:protein phosphatase